MLASSTNATLILQGQEITGSWLVTINLPGGILSTATLQVSAVELEYSLTTALPDGTRLEEGYGSVQATFTVAGDIGVGDATQTAAALFDRWNTASPLYRSDAFFALVTVDFLLATPNSYGTPERFRKFVGYVEDYVGQPDGTVDFTCLDGRQLLRSLPDIPAVITEPPYNAGLTSEFAVDALLRGATGGAVSSWPARPAGCVLSVGLRSSLTPELGSVTPYGNVPPVFVPGAMGSALLLSSNETPTFMPTTALGSTVFARFWASNISGTLSGLSSHTLSLQTAATLSYFGIDIATDGIQLGSSAYGITKATTPLAAGSSHCIELQLTAAATGYGYSGTVWIDGTATPVSTTSGNTTFGNFINLLAQGTGGSLEAVQLAPTGTPIGGTFVPQAVIDPSLNPLQVVPAMAGDPWDVLQQIAAAELAVARFDESTGVFRYQNRRSIAAAPVARTVAASSLADIGGIESGYSGVVNDANVGYTPYTFASTASRVYSAPLPIRVPAGGSYTTTVTLDAFAAVNLDATFTNAQTDNGVTDQTGSYYRASVDKAGSAEFPGTLTFTLTQPAANQITITIANATKQDAWLVSPANYTLITVGTPLLYIAGTAVTQADEHTVNYQSPPQILDVNGNVIGGGALTSRFGDTAWDGTGNPWIQDPGAAGQLASDVVVAGCLPLPDFTGLSIVPDPRIQLVDKLLIDDTARTGVVEFVQVFGYTITWSTGGTFEMSIDGRVVAPPGGGIIGPGSDNVTYASRGTIGAGSTPGSLYIYPAA